jgi:hypothetical protein
LGQWQEIMTSLPLQKPVDWQLLRCFRQHVFSSGSPLH